MRIWVVAILAMLGTGTIAATQSDISEYAKLSAEFDARQGKPELAADKRMALADCVLSAFEAERGAENIPQLLGLMRAVAAGIQFDDPVVVEFTKSHGDSYAQIVRKCQNSINNG